MILVANGGLGSAYDELELNRGICEKYDIKVRGVVLNKVRAAVGGECFDILLDILKICPLPNYRIPNMCKEQAVLVAAVNKTRSSKQQRVPTIG